MQFMADGCYQGLGKNKIGTLVTKRYVDEPSGCMCTLCEDVHVPYKGLPEDISLQKRFSKSDGQDALFNGCQPSSFLSHSSGYTMGFCSVAGVETMQGLPQLLR